jgi:hypothetical protein
MTKQTFPKRGDYAVAFKSRYVSCIGAPGYASHSYTVGIITSLTRDGKVKRIQPLSHGCELSDRDFSGAPMVIFRGALKDSAGFEAECRKRQCTSPENWNPFTGFDEVRAVALRYANGA